jgi:hypothetical protein
MYDNRGTKKNPKQPDFKCKRYKEGCEGVVWPPKFQKGASPITKVLANKVPAPAHSNVPDKQLPEELQTGTPDPKPKLTQLYLDATTFFLEKIVPKFEEKEIGLSDTAVVAGIATLFIAASKER